MRDNSIGKVRGAYGSHTGRIHRKLRENRLGTYGENRFGDYGKHTGEYIGKYGKDVPPVTPHDPALHATPRSPLLHFPPPRPTWGHPNGQSPPPATSDIRCGTGATGESTGYTGEGTRSNPCSTRGKMAISEKFPVFSKPPLPYLPVFYNFCKGIPRSGTMPSSPSRSAPVSSRYGSGIILVS